MAKYSVADAKDNLPRLIDRAREGEEVIITRHGKPVAELRPAVVPASNNQSATLEWLRKQREKGPFLNITSVELLNQLYDDPEA
jgi:prevent-host-death family protein